MPPTRSWLPLYLGIALSWGSAFIFIKSGLEFLTPFGIAFSRYALGGLAMMVIVVWRKIRLPANRTELFHIFMLSLVQSSLYGVLMALAQTRVTTALAGIAGALVPLMTFLAIAFVFRGEKLTRDQIMGLLIGLVGALAISGFWLGFGDYPAWALLALLGCTICYGLSYPYTKKYILPYKSAPEALVATQFGFSAMTLLPLFVFFGVKQAPSTFTQVGSILALGVLCTGISFVWNFKLISLAGSLVSSTVIYFVPVVAILISVIFTSETITWYQLVGCSTVLLGAAVSQGRLRHKTL